MPLVPFNGYRAYKCFFTLFTKCLLLQMHCVQNVQRVEYLLISVMHKIRSGPNDQPIVNVIRSKK